MAGEGLESSLEYLCLPMFSPSHLSSVALDLSSWPHRFGNKLTGSFSITSWRDMDNSRIYSYCSEEKLFLDMRLFNPPSRKGRQLRHRKSPDSEVETHCWSFFLGFHHLSEEMQK